MLKLEQLEAWCQDYALSLMETDSAHDVAHLRRVVAMTKVLTQSEQANPNISIAAAWLHDFVNYPKNHPQRANASFESAKKAESFLKSIGFDHADSAAVQHAIITHSFSAQVSPRTLEAKIVQDADRLDALGAIGIARCMMVGGRLDRTLYSELDPFCSTREPDDHAFTVDHFYSKLLTLESSFQTTSGRVEAHRRTEFMHLFLEQLHSEI